MRKPFADWVEVRASWFSTILREGVLTSRHLRSHAQSALPGRAGALRRGGDAVPGSRSRSQRESRIRCRTRAENAAEGTALRKPGRGSGLSRSTGNCAGPTPASTAPRNGKWPRCSPRKNRSYCRCRSNRFVITSTASASCIWTAASKSKRPIYGLPPGWIGKLVKVQWDALHVRILDPGTHQLLREHVRQQRGRLSHPRRRQSEENAAEYRRNCWRAPPAPDPTSAHSVKPSIATKASPVFAAFWACSPWRRSTASAAVDDACAAALELRVHEYRFVRRYLERRPQLTLRQVDPLIRELTQYRDLINLKTQEQPNESD